MVDSWIPFCLLISTAFLLAPFQFSNAQLVPTESRTLFQIQELLEYPQALQAWNNWTNFCFLPPTPSLTIVCSGNHITELTIVGNRSSPSHITPKMSASNFAVSQHTLSHRFSTDSFFTVLTKLSSLQKLTLVSLGLWGSLPAKVSPLRTLEVLNISSNFIFGELPHSVSNYQSLRSLVLSDNLFNGSVPDLTSLSMLEEVHLGNNYFGPSFPSLSKNLVHIDLASNSLRSKIPKDLKKFNKLQFLDVSSNKLIGPVPSFLFALPSVEHISLAKNQLSGTFPPNASCSRNLNFVDVSNNLLIGKLPSCLASKVGNKKVVIMWNCLSNTTSKYQRPSAFCQKEALAVMPTVGNQEEKEKESPLKLGIVLGIVGSVVAIFGVLGLSILVLYRRMQRKNGSIYRSESFVMEKTSVRGSPIGRHVPQPIRLTSLSLPPYHVFTPEDMQYATNSFDPSNLVVEGDQRQLYKGWLRDGSAVLVKCLKLKQKHSAQALQQHMEVISKLRHRHLASVLGHCQDHPGSASTLFIVLEDIGNGSLRDHLIVTDWRKREVLKWPQRVAIAMGVARGVQYLHTSGVVGNDIKIDNILLDHSLTAKISSYNITIPSKVGAESPLHGQDASNHHSHGEKEDIYRLGVILVEVITGRPMHTTSEVDDLKFQLERSLAESATMLRDVMDPSMRGTFAYESMKTVVQISINCLSKDPRGRPTVEDVLWHMQYAVQVQEGWTNSENLSGNLGNKL